MKKLLLLTITSFMFFSCSSIQKEKTYANLTKGTELSDYFPNSSGVLYFDNLDDAYEYINSAEYKLKKTINKKKQKGLPAILEGPKVKSDSPVTVAYFLSAMNHLSQEVTLDSPNIDLEQVLRRSVSVTNVFMIFVDDKAISLSAFYLKSGYRYSNSYSQYQKMSFNKEVYLADYPRGWDIDDAFEYLKVEN
ncbi:hypothetical protein [Spirochaeta cellobiosiphila]|uniref:hypothetical protein n=1 Tax=Spirochaeta cellobiosiphila TaxID=504483 RepID=UPI00040C9635|nr:hypothetical protein [Spirochaeta cellobiosiphila]